MFSLQRLTRLSRAFNLASQSQKLPPTDGPPTFSLYLRTWESKKHGGNSPAEMYTYVENRLLAHRLLNLFIYIACIALALRFIFSFSIWSFVSEYVVVRCQSENGKEAREDTFLLTPNFNKVTKKYHYASLASCAVICI